MVFGLNQLSEHLVKDKMKATILHSFPWALSQSIQMLALHTGFDVSPNLTGKEKKNIARKTPSSFSHFA